MVVMGVVKEEKKVYILYNPTTFSQKKIADDLKEEGFPFSFIIDNVESICISAVEECDEVWLFGEVGVKIHEVIYDFGKEEWQMG